ncbi:MAG: EAL domain-containing protein, partial [Gammaproteobacteria bacterium]|nr:EAL domain-containing protein [Gammaproteobacteria bacterium]
QSFFLADELRQSSDDLTRMVRSYVVTGEQRYKDHFQEIMAIRDGKAPRPQLYHRIYWDLVTEDALRPRHSGLAMPLLVLMQQAGFTEAEFAKLAEAKGYSDDLTQIEFAAMQLHEQARNLPSPEAAELNRQAAAMLFDSRYYQAKAGIMQPIDQFYQMIDLRSTGDIQSATVWADAARYLFVAIGIWLLYLLWQIRQYFSAVLGTSLSTLYQYISALGAENQGEPIVVTASQQDTVLGWLAKTEQRLMRADEKRALVQHRLEHLAHYDALTGLANRLLLLQTLELAMVRKPAALLGLAYLDLDGFKAINDRHGHVLGDRVLQLLALRLQQLIRPKDTLARFGGDEFVLLLNGLQSQDEGTAILQQILHEMLQPLLIDEFSLQLSASIGVTFYPQRQPLEADQLLRQADQAMYLAKQGGKNRYQCFDSAQEELLRGYHQQIEEIRLGLSLRQFVLYYQPKVNMQSGQVIGYEALIRWQHPIRGLLAPALFLPQLEQHPVGILLGQWVVSSAISQLSIWQQQGLALPLSINIAANHLQSVGFVEQLSALLLPQPDIAKLVELEILESSALEDIDLVTQIMQQCSALGVTFALDDFGTGYSSLSYLKKLPLHQIKVDQSFVRDITIDDDDLPILQGMLALARAFELEIIAEGVETEYHGVKLQQLGYQLAQGFAIAKPMPAALVFDWVQQWQSPASWQRKD